MLKQIRAHPKGNVLRLVLASHPFKTSLEAAHPDTPIECPEFVAIVSLVRFPFQEIEIPSPTILIRNGLPLIRYRFAMSGRSRTEHGQFHRFLFLPPRSRFSLACIALQ